MQFIIKDPSIEALKSILEDKKGCQFMGLKAYENSQGEIANVTLNVGVNYQNAKEKDIETLKYMKVYELDTEMDRNLLEDARVALLMAMEKPNDNISKGQKDAYTHIVPGLKYHNEKNQYYIYGFFHTKKVITEGKPKTRKSRPLTIAKNIAKKGLRTSKYRQYAIPKFNVINISGHSISFDYDESVKTEDK